MYMTTTIVYYGGGATFGATWTRKHEVMHTHTHACMHVHTHARTHVRTHARTHRHLQSWEGNLCNVRGQQSVNNKRLRVNIDGKEYNNKHMYIIIYKECMCTAQTWRATACTWMHAFRRTYIWVYIIIWSIWRDWWALYRESSWSLQEHKT